MADGRIDTTGAPPSSREPGTVTFRPAFEARAVDRTVIESVLDQARRAPSGVNTQPWKVCVMQQGARERLVARVRQRLPALCVDAALQARFWQQYRQLPGRSAWAGPAWERHDGGFLACADAAFGGGALVSLQDLDDYAGLYQAPVALVCTIDQALGLGSVLDYGMFVQNIVMAAAVRDLQVVHLAGWNGFSDIVLDSCQVTAGEGLTAVLALGHGASFPAARAQPDTAVSSRARLFTHWHD